MLDSDSATNPLRQHVVCFRARRGEHLPVRKPTTASAESRNGHADTRDRLNEHEQGSLGRGYAIAWARYFVSLATTKPSVTCGACGMSAAALS